MTQGNRPKEAPNKALIMEEDFDDEEEFEIIETFDVDIPLSSGSSESSLDSEPERKMSCVPTTDHAALVFTQHTAAVFSVGLHPQNENLVVTGGQDDKILVWNIHTGEVVLESNSFEDSVSHVAFSHDGKYVAGVDMGGRVKVWKTTIHPYQEVWSTKIDDVQWMRWHPLANVLLVGESAGSVYMWKIPSGELKLLPGHVDLTDVGSFMPDGKRAVVCYIDGSVKIFTLSNATVAVKYENVETKLNTVISLDVHPDNNLVAVGSLSSRLCILKTQGNKSVQEYRCVEEKERGETTVNTSVECVVFSKGLPITLLVAATDNALHLYDYSISKERGYIPIEEGVTRLVWPEGNNRIFVGTKVGQVAVCDVRSLSRIATLEGHSRSVLDLTISRDGKTLITTSDDETVRVFPVEDLLTRLVPTHQE